MKVETYTNGWQNQAEMAYDGLGNRKLASILQTLSADEQEIICLRYVADLSFA